MPVSRIDRGKDTGRETLAAQGLPVSPPSFLSFWRQLAPARGDTLRAAGRVSALLLLTPKIDRGDIGDRGSPCAARCFAPVSSPHRVAKMGEIQASVMPRALPGATLNTQALPDFFLASQSPRRGSPIFRAF